MKRKIAGFVIILLWIFSRAVKSYSAGDADLQELSAVAEKYADAVYTDEADWYADGELKFAISIFDEEWKALEGEEEMLAVCQLPDKLLKKLSTYELLKLTEEYPMLGDIYAANTMEEGFRNVADSFNGLRELLSREDCLEVVCYEYDNLIFPEKCAISYNECETEEEKVELFNKILHDDELLKIENEDSKPLLVCDLLEMIMLEKTTEENVETLLETVVDKATEKEKSEYFDEADKYLYISELEESMLSEALAYTVTEENVNITVKKVYWRGVAIEVKAADRIVYNDYHKMNDRISSHKDSDKLELVSVGTQQSNCHSYAWLKGLFPDKYEYYDLGIVPAKLINECIEYKIPKNGAIAYTAGHSAIVVDATHRNEIHQYDPIVIAKWAGGPIVKGPMSAGDYHMEHGNGGVVNYYWYRASTK